MKNALAAEKIELYVPFKTYLKFIAVAGGLFLIVKLIPLIGLFFLGLLLAVALRPLVDWLKQRGCSETIAVSLVSLCIILSVVAVTTLLIPPISEQVSNAVDTFPKTWQNVVDHIPEQSPFRKWAEHIVKSPDNGNSTELIKHAAVASGVVIEQILSFLLVLIFAIYLLIDGKKTYKWVTDFFSPSRREKLRKTSNEISKVVFSYVLGQGITSVCSAIYVYMALSLLKVPAALTLAVLAGMFDVLPVLGFFLAVIPAMLFAMTVTPILSVYVFLLYLLYHVIENYLIIPKIYGSRLRISSLVVMCSLLGAASIGGVLLAIAILPIVASYPIVEKIWLVNRHADAAK